ncbi:MAG: oligosaccharide flippase family protein [Syntrophales bacterium]|nr:oligosaccharide flippase family protein [Syntrophales bacterium]
MKTLKRNIIANFLGSAWIGLVNVIFFPLYIHFLGIEALGLIGIFTGMQGLLSMLDMGLSSTINREMARLQVRENSGQEMKDLLRTLEIPYWLVGILIALIVISTSPFIAFKWVHGRDLSEETVQTAIVIMGFCLAVQWPISLYAGGLMGLQRQVLVNTINILISTLRGIGSFLVLWLLSATVHAYFLWHIFTGALHVTLLFLSTWHTFPITSKKPRFRIDLLLKIWRFAAGITGITITATLLTQVDKIILSHMLPLENFGYYTLAGAVAISLYKLVTPVSSAIYPIFSSLFALNKEEEIKIMYHKATQLVTVSLIPISLVFIFFSKEILTLWTQNIVTAENAHLLVSLLVIGTVLNGIIHIPYILQLASGWTGLVFRVNTLSLIILIPLMIILTKYFGAPGAASVWIILNGGYVIFLVHIMHNKLLKTEKWHWYIKDIALPICSTLTTILLLRWLIPFSQNNLLIVGYLTVVLIFSYITCALSASVTRKWLIKNKITVKKLGRVTLL